MSAWYLISGSARLRPCPEVEAILDELPRPAGRRVRGHRDRRRPRGDRAGVSGRFRVHRRGADELDAMVRSLAPHALEPAVFTGEFDGELRVIPLDPADGSPAARTGIPILGVAR